MFNKYDKHQEMEAIKTLLKANERKLIMDVVMIGSNVLLKGFEYQDSPVLLIAVLAHERLSQLMEEGVSHHNAISQMVKEGWNQKITSSSQKLKGK